MAKKIFDADGAFHTRGLINKKGANHHEPTTDYNPKLAMYTVAFFKVYLDQTPSADGHNYDDMLHGSGSDSVCGGGDGTMADCQILR